MNIDEYVGKDKWQGNNTILNERWNEVDSKLSTFYSKNTKINRKMYDNLQSIFDWIKFDYSELDNYASASDIVRLRSRIEDLKEQYGLEGYIGYQLTEYSKKKRLKNRDLLLALLMIEYYRQYKEQNNLETELFDEIKNVVYKQVTIQTATVLKKRPPKKIEIPRAWWLGLLAKAGYTGYEWLTFKEGTLGYNVRKLYELILVQIQQGQKPDVKDSSIKKLLEKQERAYLGKAKEKQTRNYRNEYFGSLDNYLAYLVNQIVLQAIKDQGCKKVQFIAVLDETTTDMCASLNHQIFDIEGINIYKRYSLEDKAIVVYKTKGLEVGANLPPINNGFHYCRSTIIPVK